MYWYVYFNLFQDLILRLWPWNQYLHLWSTTFNQFCPRLFSTMDCLWLDTCKQSSTALSFPLCFFFFLLAAFCVAVQWEVTGHSNPRLAAAHHPTAFPGSLLSCPPFPASSSGFHLSALLVTGSSMALIHDKQSPQPTAEWETHMQNKCKWPMALSWASFSFHSALSVSPFLPHLWAVMYNLIAMKYSCCVHEDMVWHPFDRTAKLCSYQRNQTVENIAWAWRGRYSHLAWSPPFRKA